MFDVFLSTECFDVSFSKNILISDNFDTPVGSPEFQAWRVIQGCQHTSSGARSLLSNLKWP
jgi:hypothetical protein